MKKNFNVRNIIIVMLCITIIFMGIGFAILASKLDTIKQSQDVFSIEFTQVEVGTAIKGGEEEPIATKELIDDGKTLKFMFQLNNPKDELAYEITIKNTGTVPMRIIRLISAPDYIENAKQQKLIEPISITHTELKDKVLYPEETAKIKLVVSYGLSNTINQYNIPYQLTILATNKK